VTGSLVVTDAYSLRHPLVELLHGEGLSSSFSLHIGGDPRRELGAKIRRLLPG